MDKSNLNKELRRVRQGLLKIRSSRASMRIKPASGSLTPLGAFAENDPEVHVSFCNDTLPQAESSKFTEKNKTTLLTTN